MRHFLLSTSAMLVLAACASTETVEIETVEVEVSGADLISADMIESHIRYLADDRLEGRDTGSAGYNMAADYVAEHYADMGLQPAGADGSYFEPVPLRTVAADLQSAEFTIDGEALALLEDFVIVPNTNNPEADITAEAVFVGYAIDNDAIGVNSFSGVDLDGKIAVLVPGTPASLEGAIASQAADLNTKFQAAANNGAIGAVMLFGDGLTPFTYAQIAQFATRPSMALAGNDDGGSDQPVSVNAIVSGDAASQLFLSGQMSTEDLFAAASEGAFLESFEIGTELHLAMNTNVEMLESPNVVAIIPGSDPELADESVVISAHLDHLGICQPLNEDDSICNGALDNASGIAIMLETARAIMGAEEQPRRSVILVAVTAEEKGLLGAQHLAANPPAAFGEMVANVNMDMPILRYEFTDMVAFGAEHSSLGPVASAATERAGMFLSPDPVPEQGLFTRSDHFRFVQQGIPALFLVAGFSSPDEIDDEGGAFNRFLAGDYHGINDEPEFTDAANPEVTELNWEMGAKFARVNYEIIMAIANEDERPIWNEDSPFNPDNQ